MAKSFHRSRWNNRDVVTGTTMLFLGVVIAGYVERDSFGQTTFDTVLGTVVQAPAQTSSEEAEKTAVSNLIKAIRSKDIGGFEQLCREIKTAKALSQCIPVIRESLRDPDPNIKFLGLIAIGSFGLMRDQETSRQVPEAKSLLPEVVAMIGDRDLVVRYWAVITARDTDSIDDSAATKAIPALIEFLRYRLKDQDIPRGEARAIGLLGSYRLYDGIHQVAAEALAKIGPRALPALIKALNNDDAHIREGAIRALGEIGPPAKQVAPLLLAATSDKDNGVRFRAAVALWKVDRQAKPALPVLIEFVQSPDVAVGLVAAETLGQMGSEAKEAVPVLAEVMKIDRHLVSWFCAAALGKIGPEAKAAVPALIEVLKVEDEPPPKLPESINDPLPTPVVIKEKNPYLQFEAAKAIWLVDRQSKVAVPVLIELLNREYYGSRPHASRAAEVLGEIGPDAIDAVPELLKLARVEDPSVREAAIKALKKIDPKAKWN